MIPAACALALALTAPAEAPAAAPRYDAEAAAAIDAMEPAAAAIKDYTMRLVKREQIDDQTLRTETISVKWQRPQRVYIKRLDGAREGQEAIYVQGWNKDRVRVRKGFNWNLSPYGQLAMDDAHHPITEISLVHLVELVVDNVRRAHAKSFGTLTFGAREKLFGRAVVRVEATFPATGTTPTLEKGQTIWDVAKASHQSMYVILHANEHRGWSLAVPPKPGDAMLVPEFYAGRFVVWIDEALHLPLQIDLYDHEGRFYEHYEHHDLKLNVGLKPVDFDPANPAYKF